MLGLSIYRFFFVAAYRHESVAYNTTLDYFSIKEEDTSWIIPVLVRVSNDLRVVATMVRIVTVRVILHRFNA